MTEPQHPNPFGAMPGQPASRDNDRAAPPPPAQATPHGSPTPAQYGTPPNRPATPGAAGAEQSRAQQSPSGAKPAQPPVSAEEAEAARSADDAETLAQAQAELATLKAKTSDLADQYLRAKADADNARRRADDEVAKARKFAIEAFAESLLPVLDSLEAGLAIKEATVQQIREGTEATLRQLTAALERNKVLPVDPKPGEKFDPNRHHAIGIAPAAGNGTTAQPPNTIVSVLQKGYTIADRVLRPALVTVSAPA